MNNSKFRKEKLIRINGRENVSNIINPVTGDFLYIYTPMILVTGGTGLVGSHLLYHLLIRGERVRAVHRPGTSPDQVRKVFGYYEHPFGEENASGVNSRSLKNHSLGISNPSGEENRASSNLRQSSAAPGRSSDNPAEPKDEITEDETGKSGPGNTEISSHVGQAGQSGQAHESGKNLSGISSGKPGSRAPGVTAASTRSSDGLALTPDELFNQIEWFPADMLDPWSMNEAMEGIEKVYHCAANVSFDPSERRDTIHNNIEITATIVNLCLSHNVKKLCHVSSVAALGTRYDGQPVTEDDLWKPSKRRHAYSIGKFHSEMEVWRGISEGLNAVIVNPSVILGPGNWKRGSAGFFTRIKKGLKYYTEGMTGFVDVRDVCRCMIGLMESDISEERFIINGEDIYYRDLFNMIADALGAPRPDIHATKTLAEMGWRLEWLRSKLTLSKPLLTRDTARSGRGVSRYSSNKIKEVLGHQFIPIKDTVAWTAAMYLSGI